MVCVCVCVESRGFWTKSVVSTCSYATYNGKWSLLRRIWRIRRKIRPDSTVIRLIRNSEPSLFWRARKIYCEYCIDNRRPRTDESGSNGQKRIYFILVSPQKFFFSYLCGMNVKQNTLYKGLYRDPRVLWTTATLWSSRFNGPKRVIAKSVDRRRLIETCG